MTSVRDIMTWGAVAVVPDAAKDEVVDRLVSQHADVVFVAVDGFVVGAIGVGDVLEHAGCQTDPAMVAWHPAVHAALTDAPDAAARDLMRPVTPSVRPGDSVGTAAAAMLASGADVCPVARDGKLLGSVGRRALVQAAPAARRHEPVARRAGA